MKSDNGNLLPVASNLLARKNVNALKIPRKLYLALAVTLLASMGISLPYPVLTPLFIDATPTSLNSFAGLDSTTLLTILLAIYPLGIFIGSSFIGALSDRFGRRRVLAQTLVICFVGYLVSAYALYIQDYLLLLISRFLTGITEGNVAIARAIALDIGDDDSSGAQMDKVRAVSLINSSVFLGWLLGPLIGGALADQQAYYAMLAAAVGALICWSLVNWALEETNKTKPVNAMSVWRSAIEENSLQLIRDIWVRKLFYMYFFYTLEVNLFYEFYPVWLVDVQGYSALDIGLATTNMTIFMTLASVFLVTLVQKRFGLVSPMFILMWLLALVLALVPSSRDITTHMAFAMSGVLLAVFNGLMPVYISDEQKGKSNGAVMGLLTMTFCISNVVAAVFGGILLQWNSDSPLYLSAVLFIVASSLFYLWFIRQERIEQEA